jgi:hypothetical protein
VAHHLTQRGNRRQQVFFGDDDYAAYRGRARGRIWPGATNGLVQAGPLLDQAPDWPAFLASGLSEDEREALRAGERTGRPLGSAAFVAGLEQSLRRPLARRKPGPKPQVQES